MIQRLSIPDRGRFSTSNGYSEPYFDKFTTPRFLVRYADSVYTTQNAGMSVHWYNSTTDARTDTHTAYANSLFPIAKFYYANGYPPFFTNPNPTNNWACKFQFKFFAPIGLNYRFFFGGAGTIEANSFKINDAVYLTKTKYMNFSDTQLASVAYGDMFQGAWRKVEFIYGSGKRMQPSNIEYGLIAMWQSDNMPEPVPFSAALCCPLSVATPISTEDGTTIKWHTVVPVTDVAYAISKDNIATLKFSVPFIHTSNYAYNGYFHSSGNLIYITDRSTIKPFRMVEYYEGYSTLTGVEYAKKFTGQIKDFSNDYTVGELNKIDVQCEDFSSFLKESFNLYAPTPIDYIQVGYTYPRSVYNHNGYNKAVDGEQKPNTFDGWDIYKFVQIILTESCIDPYLFYKKKTFTNLSYAAVTGNYKMLYTEATANSVKFPIGINYGNAKNPNTESDDKYNYSIGTGEFYFDVLHNFLSPYYYGFYFDEHGHPTINGNNIPCQTIDNVGFLRTGWSDGINYSAFQTTYSSCRAVASAGVTIIGAAADIIFLTNPRTGHPTQPTTISAKIEVRRPSTGLLFTEYTNLYSSTARAYYDGVDVNLGRNPCSVRLSDSTMKYDTYRISITPQNSYPVFLDAVLVYDKDIVTPTQIFESDDVNKKGAIVSLEVEDRARDLRNDVYVYGNLIGDIQGTDNQDVKVTINPNNPIYRYNYSIARDINSIWNASASNYVGRSIKLLIQDPKIVNQEQANSVSYNVLTKYRQPSKKGTITILGNPLVQVNDCIGIKDSYTKYVTTSDSVWIDSIRTEISRNITGIKYLTSIETTPVQPEDAYWPKPDPVFSDNAIRNVRLANQGRMVQLNASISSANTTTITLKATPLNGYYGCGPIPEKGYLRLFHTTGIDIPENKIYTFETRQDQKTYPYRVEEIIYYEKNDLLSTASTMLLKNVQRGCWGSYATSHAANCKFYCAIDPYVADAANIYPSVTFDLLMSGKLRVQVIGITPIGAEVVDTLTGIDNNKWPRDGWDDVSWGKYTYYWSCKDQIGKYNDIATKGEIKKKGFYASEIETDYSGIENIPNPKFDPNTPRSHTNREYIQYFYSKDSYLQDGKFYFQIDLMTADKTKQYTYKTKPNIEDLTQDTSMGLIYIKRSPTGSIGLRMSTAGLYAKWDVTEYNITNLAETQSFAPLTIPWQTFPWIHDTAKSTNLQDGINFTIYDYSPGVYATTLANGLNSNRRESIKNPYAIREYLLDIQYNVITYAWILGLTTDANNNNVRISQWYFVPQKGDFTTKEWLSLNNSGSGRTYKFNPKTWLGDTPIEYFPTALMDLWKDLYKAGTFNVNTGVQINHVIFFSGFIYDKSGRNVWVMMPSKALTQGNEFALNNMFDKSDYNLFPKKERNLLGWDDVGKAYMYRVGKNAAQSYSNLISNLFSQPLPFSKLLQKTGAILWYDKDIYNGVTEPAATIIWGAWEVSRNSWWEGDLSCVKTHVNQCGNKSLFDIKDVQNSIMPSHFAVWFAIPNSTIISLVAGR